MYSSNSIALEGDYVTVTEDMTYVVCRISSSTFDQNWPTLQRGLSAIAKQLVLIGKTEVQDLLTY